MNGRINVASIGQERATQDPQDAIVEATGKYTDVALTLSDSVKYPMLPKGPSPMPFSGMSAPASGGR